MKDKNRYLLLCLCNDLGYSLVGNAESEQLGDLRKEFLELSKLSSSAYSYSDFFKKFDSIFRPSRARILSRSDHLSFEEFRDVYQLLSFQLKIKKAHTNDQSSKYEQAFIQTNEETKAYRVDSRNTVSRLARYVTRLSSINLDLSPASIEIGARHGPGTVYDGSTYDDKSWWTHSFRSLEAMLPGDWWFANANFACDLSSDRYYRYEDYIVARLALVPKDYRGPRGVFISPKEAMFVQLGIHEALMRSVRSSILGDFVDMQDQSRSRDLAQLGSYCGHISTLDLKDASDRIPLALVAYLFNRQDYLALARSRPSHVVLPSGKTIKIAMLSPMGDGKTFGSLTIVVTALCLASMLCQDGYLPTDRPSIIREAIRSYAGNLRIFGDDVAVHTKYYQSVVSGLEAHNLRVNVGKSFNTGFFREACGMDAYRGRSVTPLRQKFNLNSYYRNDWESIIAFSNRAKYEFGYTGVSGQCEGFLKEVGVRFAYTSNHVCSPTSILRNPNDVIRCNLISNNRITLSDEHHLVALGSVKGRDQHLFPSTDDRYRLSYCLFPHNADAYESERISGTEIKHLYLGDSDDSFGRPTKGALEPRSGWVKV